MHLFEWMCKNELNGCKTLCSSQIFSSRERRVGGGKTKPSGVGQARREGRHRIFHDQGADAWLWPRSVASEFGRTEFILTISRRQVCTNTLIFTISPSVTAIFCDTWALPATRNEGEEGRAADDEKGRLGPVAWDWAIRPGSKGDHAQRQGASDSPVSTSYSTGNCSQLFDRVAKNFRLLSTS